jgi:hypothetical protein
MAFLTINGFDLGILDGSASLPTEAIGYEVRAYSGHMLQSTRGRARSIEATTPILSSSDATAVRGLLQGLGHFWGFSDAYSSRGLGPASGSGSYTVSSGNINVASGATVTFNTNVGSSWSLLVRYNSGPGTYTSDSGGAKYLNGATTALTVSNIADVSSGDFQLKGQAITTGTPTAQSYSFAAVVPYVFTTAMHVAFSASASPFQSELPRLTVSGNAFRGESLTMRLRHGSYSEEPVQFMSGGSITTGFKLSFTLDEVL